MKRSIFLKNYYFPYKYSVDLLFWTHTDPSIALFLQRIFFQWPQSYIDQWDQSKKLKMNMVIKAIWILQWNNHNEIITDSFCIWHTDTAELERNSNNKMTMTCLNCRNWQRHPVELQTKEEFGSFGMESLKLAPTLTLIYLFTYIYSNKTNT